MPVVDRRQPRRLEERPARLAGQGPERHRRIGGPEGRGANLRDRRSERIGEHREPVDVRQLPLIGRHAERRVALGVLDRGVSLAGGEAQIRHLHVVLEVDERLRIELRPGALRHPPDGLRRRLRRRLGGRRRRASGPKPELFGGPDAGAVPVFEARRGREQARGRARRHDEGRPVRPPRRPRRVRREMPRHVVPAQLAAAVRPEMHDRRPPARHRDGVAGDLLDHPACAALRADPHRLDPRAALDRGDAHARRDPDARRTRRLRQHAPGLGAGIHHQRHIEPRRLQRQRGPIGVVVAGDDDRARAGAHAPERHEVAHRRGQHHPGTVVPREGERPLQRTGRRHHAPGADPPEPPPRPVAAQPLLGQHVAVVVDAGRGHPRPAVDVRHRVERRQLLRHPVVSGHPRDRHVVGQHPAAPVRGLLDQHHPRPRGARRRRRRETGGPAADHQHVDMRIDEVVAVRIRRHRRGAEPGRPADRRLEQPLPGGARDG